MSYETLEPAGAKSRLDGDEGWTYLDVRTPEEFEAGHAPGAYNIPWLFRGPAGAEVNEAFVASVAQHFPKDARLVVGCAAGGRSRHACEALTEHGYAALINMEGGYSGRQDMSGAVVVQGWAACGFPTTTEPVAGRTWSELGS